MVDNYYSLLDYAKQVNIQFIVNKIGVIQTVKSSKHVC